KRDDAKDANTVELIRAGRNGAAVGYGPGERRDPVNINAGARVVSARNNRAAVGDPPGKDGNADGPDAGSGRADDAGGRVADTTGKTRDTADQNGAGEASA